ncbi:MAG: hypothetical protein H7A44_13555 [Opitutaceae bacterium]|nr:hypothetical protein [Opitutaceae bacterium]
MLGDRTLLDAVVSGLGKDDNVNSVVLFGSQARDPGLPAASDGWSDIDLHLIVADVGAFAAASNLETLGPKPPKLHVIRNASGGVRKVTLLYEDAEVDLVVIPRWQMQLARLSLALGCQERIVPLRTALNEMSTIMRGGYRFLKGEATWGKFYADVVAKLPGQRWGDAEVRAAADAFLCDYLWVLQKLARGELIAAQRSLHLQLADANYRLMHELRLRQGRPTFREARRLEKLLVAVEREMLQVSARLAAPELQAAADKALATMKILVGELLPGWSPPADYAAMVGRVIISN